MTNENQTLNDCRVQAEREATFEEVVGLRRDMIGNLGEFVLKLKTHPDCTKTPTEDSGRDRSEMIANIMLAYRHLEDARMRLGKAIQAKNGGVSCYEDKKIEVDAEKRLRIIKKLDMPIGLLERVIKELNK